MRKFFSLFAAVLFAASMMASEVVFTNADFAGQGTANTGSEVSASKDGVTFTYSKGFSADESLRCYAHGALSISAEKKISKINFTTTGGKTGGLDAEVTVNAWDYEVADLASQARFTEIKVTLGEGGGDTPGGGDEPGGDDPVVTDPTNCAEAREAALSVSENNEEYNGGKSYTIQGYVTSIPYAWKNGNMSFWIADTKDGGNVLEAYKCAVENEADAPAVGDKVKVTGKLTKYNDTPEFAAGCTVEIVEKAGGNTPGGDTPGGDTPGGDTQGLEGITILPSDFTLVENADYSTTKEGVTIAVTASTVTADQMRIFKGQSITISAAANITGIEFTCTANGTAKYGPGCFAAQDGYTFEAEGKTGTWVGSAKSVSFTASANQVRATQIVVTLEGGDTPVEPTVNYYVAGTMNGWAANADYMLTPSNNGEYKGEFAFAENDEFKVIGVEGETITWYPAGMNNNFQITQAGDYKIFFNPAGNVDGWYEGYFNVLMKEEPVVTAITCLDVYQKAKDDVVDLLNDVVVTFANGKNVWVRDASASMLIYLPADGSYQAGDVLSGVAGTVDIYNGVYEIKPSADQVAAIVATAGEAPAAIPASVLEVFDVNKYIVMQNVAAEGTFEEGKQSNLTINGVAVRNQFKNGYTFEAGKTYNIYGVVTIYQNNPQVYFITAEVAGDVPEPTVKYYVAGSMNGWAADAAYMLTPNNESLYQGEFTFAANDEFKVIGVEGETTTWFPGGVDNNFKITEAGDYKITFNPAGNVEGWYEGFFNVVKKEEPVIPQYEVAEAIAAGLADDTEIEVRGIVTKMQIKGKNFANYGSACIYVKDATDAEGEFEFYNCYSFESAKFTSTIPAYDATSTAWADLTKLADANGNEIRLGDTIVAFGKYKLFNSTYELNTGCYIVDIKSAPVAPAQDINVNMSNGLIYEDYVADDGWWQIYGSNEKFDVSISNVKTTQAEGTYTISDLDADYTYVGVINGNDTNYVSFVDGSVTLSIDAQTGNVTVAGTLVGDDGNNYILNLQFIVPTPQETVNVNIQNAELIDDYADYGLYGVYGMDANNVYVQLGIWAEDGFQGQFTEEDLDLKYIGSAIFEGEEQVNIYTAAITVTPGNNGSYNIEATILGYNNKQYNVTMTIPASEPTGIEEAIAAGKTVKKINNGMLVIEKAGVKYSVMGQKIR